MTFFEGTFNVLNLDPEHRRLLHSHIPLLLSLSLLTFFLGYYVLAPATGFLLGISIAILCVNVMMVSEAYEIYKNASIFAKALRSGVALGEGDLKAVAFLNQSLPKLSAYYVILTVLFLASFMASPYIELAFILAVSHFANAILGSSASIGVISAYVGALAVATLAVGFITLGGAVKHRIFDIGSNISLATLDGQFERNTLHHRSGGKLIINKHDEKPDTTERTEDTHA